MTSFAFIAGLLPLVLANGAGAIGNRTIGASSAGGMLLGTLLGVLVVPGLYYVFGGLSENKHLIRDEHESPITETIEYGDV
jgi:HAE1 family hydrophobic/amphiphilic exporter-1